MSSEDALTDFIQTLSNLPSEYAHIMAEIDHKDKKVAELMQRVARRDSEIQKHHKTLGLHVENPKEAESVQKCRADLARADTVTDEKIALAERAARLMQRHLAKLQIELGKLQGEPTPNIAARFGMRLPPEQMSQPAFSPSAIPGGPLVDPSVKRRKLALEPLHTSRAHSPAIPSALSRASPALLPPHSAASSTPSTRKRKTPAPVEEDEDAEGEDDASGSDDNEGDFMDQDAEAEADPPGDDQLYCICQKVSYGEMVGCDNQACAYEWFHLPCVGLKEPPKGKWYCPACSSGNARLPSNPPSSASANAAGGQNRHRSGGRR